MVNKKKIVIIAFCVMIISLNTACQWNGINLLSKNEASPKPKPTPVSQVHEPVVQVSAPQPTDTPAPLQSVTSTQAANISSASSVESIVVSNEDAVGILENIEYNSSNIVFDIIKLDWDKAQSRLNSIKIKTEALKPAFNNTATQKKLLDDMAVAISKLDSSISAKKVHESKDSANLITKYIPDMEDGFKAKFKTDFGRVGYLVRQVRINVNASNWGQARSNCSSAKEVWNRLKAALGDEYKTSVEDIDKYFDGLEKSVQSKDAKSAVLNTNIILDKASILKSEVKSSN